MLEVVAVVVAQWLRGSVAQVGAVVDSESEETLRAALDAAVCRNACSRIGNLEYQTLLSRQLIRPFRHFFGLSDLLGRH